MKEKSPEFAVHFDRTFKQYPIVGEPPKVVLGGIDLRVRPGQFMSVVGPSGCGKTTLLKQILGSEQPTSGTVLVAGAPRLHEDSRVGIIFQDYSLYPFRTALDNIAVGLELRDLSLTQRLRAVSLRKVLPGRLAKVFASVRQINDYRERARVMLEKVGLNPADALKYPHQLSGGMRQRVACAQALIMEPDVLLLDEALGALDPATRERMQLHLLEVHQRTQATMIMITHDMREAVFCAHRAVVLSQYYTVDGVPGEGSRILLDVALPQTTTRQEKYFTPELAEWEKRITTFGMHRRYVVRYEDAILEHPDAVRPGA